MCYAVCTVRKQQQRENKMSNIEKQIANWATKWKDVVGTTGDPLPLGWVDAVCDSGISLDGVAESEKHLDYTTVDLPITDSMKDEFYDIMEENDLGDEEEVLGDYADIIKESVQ
jgi:hypothetical protein